MIWKDLFIVFKTCSLFAAPSKGYAHRSLTIDTLLAVDPHGLHRAPPLVSSSAINEALRTIPCLIHNPRVLRCRRQAPHRSEAWPLTSPQLSRPSSSRFPQCSLVSKPWRCSLAISTIPTIPTIRRFDRTIGNCRRPARAFGVGLRRGNY